MLLEGLKLRRLLVNMIGALFLVGRRYSIRGSSRLQVRGGRG